MDDFQFEDYRHPWETGDHWELKREFMERYKDTYPVDRLLCLAQAYSNMELLHCSYPLDVMKEIQELSKPLKACKIFRERGGIASSHPNDATTPAKRGKRKAKDENAGRKAKFINFCAASDVPKMDTDKKYSTQELIVSSGIEAVSCKKEQHADPVAETVVEEQHASKVDLVDTMLYKMKQLAQELRNRMPFKSTVAAIFHNVCSRTKVNPTFETLYDRKLSFVRKPREIMEEDMKKKKKKLPYFKIDSIKYTCRLLIDGILMASAEENTKKKARVAAIEKAVATLLDSSDLYAELVETVKNACESGSVSSICAPESSCAPKNFSSGIIDSTQKIGSRSSVDSLASNFKQVSDEEPNVILSLDVNETKLHLRNAFGRELMLKFSKEISHSRAIGDHAAITHAARLLNIDAGFSFQLDDQPSPKGFFTCYLFLENIFAGIGEGKSKNTAMRKAASYSIANLFNPRVWLCDMHDDNVSSNAALDLNNTNAAAGDMPNVPLDSNNINASICDDDIEKNASENKKYVLLGSDDPEANPYLCLKSLSETSGTCSITEDDVESIFAIIKNLEYYSHLPSVTALFNMAEKAKSSKYISYVISANGNTTVTSKQYLCEVFFKNILISSGCGRSKIKSKYSAANAAVEKLKTMTNFIFKEYNESTSTAIPSSDILKVPAITSPFVVNRSLLNSTLQKQFVIMDNTEIVSVCQGSPAQILNYSSSFCQKPILYQYSEYSASKEGPFKHKFDLVLDGVIIGTGMSKFKNEAKKLAATFALANLKKLVYTIQIRDIPNKDDLVINRHQLINSKYGSGALTEDTNIGCKMLKSMGWTGGGIGKTSGIVEPIWADKASFRGQGFGFESSGNSDFRKKILALLHEFKRSKSFNDLIFAKDFSKEERKEIHTHASRLSLNSTSYGIENNRQLFVRNKFSALELLDHLVNNGGSTIKYELVDLSYEK